MGGFFFFVESVASGLYIFGGLAIAWCLRGLYLARRELRASQFRLEREQAEQRGGRALTGLLLTINLLVAVWGISTMAAPTWREGLPATANPAAQTRQYQTSAAGGQGTPFEVTRRAGDSGPVIPVTAPPPSTPKGTILPSQGRIGCIRDQAWIEFPDNGQVIFDVITIQGTANIDGFAFYRFEIKADNPAEEFRSIGGAQGDRTQPVIDGELGQLIPFNYLPGAYRYRLTVFDSNSVLRASCEISIFISDPIPTPTPIGG
jgi:hypothetical protein